MTLRLTKEYYGTGQVVYADSVFSSVKTLLTLRERGLLFMGMIKGTPLYGHDKGDSSLWA